MRRHGANERLQIAAIGVGGKGGVTETNRDMILLPHVHIDQKIRLCTKSYPKAAKFNDYREMFSHMGDKIDTLISTPDHTHAHAAQLYKSRNSSFYSGTFGSFPGSEPVG